MFCEKIKNETAVGWNTWNTENMASYVFLPHGFSVALSFKDHSEDFIVRKCGVGEKKNIRVEALPRTYDASYTELLVSFAKSELLVQSTVKDNELVVLVTPLKRGPMPTVAIAECGFLWGRDGAIRKSGGRILAESGDKSFMLYTSGKMLNYPYSFSNTFYVATALDSPVVFSTVECSVHEATELIEAAKRQMDEKDRAYGELYEYVRAMRACLAWNTVYEPENGFVCTPVNRQWSVAWGGFVIFPWDSFFISLMIAYEDVRIAMSNTLAVLNGVDENGFLPNFRSICGYRSADRSNPPVGSYVCLQIYKKCKDREYLEHVYGKLLAWNEWFWRNRRTSEGALAWGSNNTEPKFGKLYESYYVNTTSGGTFESGMDFCAVYNDVEFDEQRSVMKIEDVALTSLYYFDCKALLEMSVILGKDCSAIEERMDKVRAALSSLWDDANGIFNSRSTENGEFCKHIGPMSFWPLLSNCASDLQIERMLKENFYNPERFFGEYMIPTVSLSDEGYKPDEILFRGRIWPPVNFLTYLALKQAGCKKECEILARKGGKLFMKEWLEHRHVHENHHTQTGKGDMTGSCPFYGWGALHAYMMIDFSESQK